MANSTTTSLHPDEADGDVLAWRVEGMDCASCVAKVRTAVERLPGISAVEVNLMTERLTIHGAAGGANPDAVERQVAALGYRPTRLAPLARRALSQSSHDGGGDHAGHLHAHSEAEVAEERAGTVWWRTGKARLVALLGGLVAAAWGLSYLFPREASWIYLAATLVALVGEFRIGA